MNYLDVPTLLPGGLTPRQLGAIDWRSAADVIRDYCYAHGDGSIRATSTWEQQVRFEWAARAREWRL